MPRSCRITIYRPSDFPRSKRDKQLQISGSVNMASPCTVLIDGYEVGEVWANQVKSFDVKPGKHSVRLRQLIVKSNEVLVNVEDGATAQLACLSARRIIFSTFQKFTSIRFLHEMTPEEKADVDNWAASQPTPPTPRNLGIEGQG